MNRIAHMVRLAVEGHGGAVEGLKVLAGRFTAEVTRPNRGGQVRTVKEAGAEFMGMVCGAVGTHMDAGSTGEPEDPCVWVDSLPASEPESSASAGSNTNRVRVLTPASDIRRRKVVWAWEDTHGGRIPAGSLCIAAGREGTGKSSFGLHLAAELTHGRLPGAFVDTPRNVIICAFEDSWEYTLVPRLAAAGADMRRVFKFGLVNKIDGEELTVSLPGDLDELRRGIDDLGAVLVIVDPLMSAVSSTVDTHNERQTRTALDPLTRVARETGAVVLGIAHFNKGSGTDPASRVTGSGAFKNVPRSLFTFAKSAEGTRVMSQEKNSLGRDGLPSLEYRIDSVEVPTEDGPDSFGRFVFVGDATTDVQTILAEQPAQAGEDREEQDAAAETLRDYLISEGGTAPANKCKKHLSSAGFPTANATLSRVRKRARVRTRKEGNFPHGAWVWYLIDAEQPEA
jgi:hypothetical protein